MTACTFCPSCAGRGQITGPLSISYEMDPGDPFNLTVRLCDECEGTGVVTKLRDAAIEALAMQKVLPIIDKVMAEWRDELDAVDTWENEGGRCSAGR